MTVEQIEQFIKEMQETGELLELFNSRGIDVKPS